MILEQSPEGSAQQTVKVWGGKGMASAKAPRPC